MTLTEALRPPQIDLQPVENIRAYRERHGREYIRKAAAVLKTAFEVTGDTGCPTYLMFCGLLKRPEPTPGNLKLAAVAMQALGRVVREQHEMTKNAASPAALLATARSAIAAGAAIPGPVLQALAFMGGTAGALAGGTAWATGRALGVEDQKAREMEIQRDTYRRLTSEVQNELKRRRMTPNPANTAAAVDYLT